MMRFLIGLPFGAALLVVVLELLFRLLPVSSATLTAYHGDPDILSYPPHHEWRTATGWDLRNAQTLRANGAGFAGSVEFRRQPDAVALIGDSYVEASMLGATDRPGAALGALLGDHVTVYSLGAPGTALLDYAHRLRWAAREYGVRRFVVWMEAGDVRQSFCGSGNVHAHCLDPVTFQPKIERQAPAGSLKALLRHSALAQYVVSQLKLTGPRLMHGLFAESAPAHDPAASMAGRADLTTRAREISESENTLARQRAAAVADAFFAMLQNIEFDDLIIVVSGNPAKPEHPSRGIPPLAPQLAAERSAFIELVDGRRGAIVVDVNSVIADHWKRSDLSLVVGPYDGHLNPLGIRLVMSAVAGFLDRSRHTIGTVN